MSPPRRPARNRARRHRQSPAGGSPPSRSRRISINRSSPVPPAATSAGWRTLAVLSRFRRDFHACLTTRPDGLSGLADAALCKGRAGARTLARMAPAPEHRRGGTARCMTRLSHGRIGTGRPRWPLAGLPLPRAADGRLVVSTRSSWPTRRGRTGSTLPVPRSSGPTHAGAGTTCNFPGRASFVAAKDRVRWGRNFFANDLGGAVRTWTSGAGTSPWNQLVLAALVVLDAGYHVTWLARLPAGLPVEPPGRAVTR